MKIDFSLFRSDLLTNLYFYDYIACLIANNSLKYCKNILKCDKSPFFKVDTIKTWYHYQIQEYWKCGGLWGN